MIADKVQRYDLEPIMRPDVAGDWVVYYEMQTLHASLIDLIEKTQSCTSGLSFGECLEEIKRRLATAKGSTETEGR